MPQPTQLVLDVKAEYIPDGDSVLVAVSLTDPTQDIGFPGHVKTGYCSLMYRDREVRRINFDRRFGNGPGSPGDFVFQFLHPKFDQDMKVYVEVEAPIVGQQTDGIHRRNVPVTRVAKDYIPLQPQVDTGADANDELRSKLRIKEEL